MLTIINQKIKEMLVSQLKMLLNMLCKTQPIEFKLYVVYTDENFNGVVYTVNAGNDNFDLYNIPFHFEIGAKYSVTIDADPLGEFIVVTTDYEGRFDIKLVNNNKLIYHSSNMNISCSIDRILYNEFVGKNVSISVDKVS